MSTLVTIVTIVKTGLLLAVAYNVWQIQDDTIGYAFGFLVWYVLISDISNRKRG